MLDHDFREQAVADRLASLSRDWAPVPHRRSVRLALGNWLIGAGRRLAPEAGGSALAHEALPRC
jgi:hypothetical protein